MGTTNGAGAQNVQIIIMSPDHRVLQALPGFWHPEDLARELRLSLVLYSLWKSDQSKTAKDEVYRRLQLFALEQHPRRTYARSRFQGFAESTERKKATLGSRDTFDGQGKLKRINRIVHERMAQLPFRKWSIFQRSLPEFSDLGERFYDLNARIDGKGERFEYAAKNAAKQARAFDKLVAQARSKERKKKRGRSQR